MGKAKEYRDMSIPELNALIDDTQKELFKIVNEFKLTKKLEKPHLIRQKKKEKARMLTVLTEKQPSAQQEIA
jgi:large subunit ribosomal protein L29